MSLSRERVVEQASGIAAGWSPPGAPASWALTAETFRVLAAEPALLDVAEDVPPDRLPPLLLSAALRYLVERDRPEPLAAYYPRPGTGQPPLDEGFAPSLAAFARDNATELEGLCAEHRYQMNEVGRCADVLAVLGDVLRDGDDRPVALVDLGTGAGLGLHLDRYHYRYRRADGRVHEVGDAASPVHLECALRGDDPPLPGRLPTVAARVGVDVEPLDLDDDTVRAWLAACIPPETGAVDRFAAASDLARAHPAPLHRGDLVDVLPRVSADLPPDALLCLVDTYVHVFLGDGDRARFRDALPALGRDVVWISVDPLVPLGPDAHATVQGLPVPAAALEASRSGVTGVVGRYDVRDGRSGGAVLGLAHPGAAWLDWLPAPQAR